MAATAVDSGEGQDAQRGQLNGFVALARNHLVEHCAWQDCDECREIVDGLDRTYFPARVTGAPASAESDEAAP